MREAFAITFYEGSIRIDDTFVDWVRTRTLSTQPTYAPIVNRLIKQIDPFFRHFRPILGLCFPGLNIDA